MRGLKDELALSMSRADAAKVASSFDSDVAHATLLSTGSHSYQNTANEHTELATWLDSYSSVLDAARDSDGVRRSLLVQLTSASNVRWLLSAGEAMRFVPLLQNNARFEYRNDMMAESVAGKEVGVIDFLGMTRVLSATIGMRDAVHFDQGVYGVLLDYIADVIAG